MQFHFVKAERLHHFPCWFMLMLRLILNGGKREPDLLQLQFLYSLSRKSACHKTRRIRWFLHEQSLKYNCRLIINLCGNKFDFFSGKLKHQLILHIKCLNYQRTAKLVLVGINFMQKNVFDIKSKNVSAGKVSQ